LIAGSSPGFQKNAAFSGILNRALSGAGFALLEMEGSESKKKQKKSIAHVSLMK
jgi:hypothetical protein